MLKTEIIKVVAGLFASILLFLAIAIWRVFDSTTFIFVQILVLAMALLIFLYIISILFHVSFLKEQELLATLMAFILASFLLLNIDRSRSVFLIKWVGEATQFGPISTNQLIESKNLSIDEKKAILQRIHEQGQIKLIDTKENAISLTWIGQLFFKLAKFMADIFNLDGYKKA